MEKAVPKTKNEAFAQLDVMLSEDDKKALATGDAIEFHFTLGMWIPTTGYINRMRMS